MAAGDKEDLVTEAPKAVSFGGRSDSGNFRARRWQNRPEAGEQDKQFDERTLHVARVARVVKGGRRFRFRALVVVGDRKGRVGIGIAKGADVSTATTKASETAKKQMVNINLFKGTLPHESEAKVGGAHVLLKPASAGTGLIAGGAIRSVLEIAGVRNALSKSLGSNNKVNIAYATVEALNNLVPEKDWITHSKSALSTPNKASKSAVSKETKPKTAKKPPVSEAKK